MGMGAIGSGLTGADLSRVAGNLPVDAPATAQRATVAAQTLGDSVATLLNDLSVGDIAKLIDLIAGSLPVQDTARLQNLVQTFLSAAAEINVTPALNALSDIVALDPSYPEILRANPVIEPIRASVDQFLDRQTTLAKMDAEGRLGQAAQQVGTSAPEKLAGWDMRPATMLAVANRMFDAGGLPNYLRAAELAQVVINASLWVPGLVGVPAEASELRRMKVRDAAMLPGGAAREAMRRAASLMRGSLRTLWLRAPLLILLLAWLLLGIAGGLASMLWRQISVETWPGALSAVAFNVWGTGFLALVALGFYAGVRKVRF